MSATGEQLSGTAGALEARRRLIEALELDLVGPGRGLGDPEEMLHPRERPSNWYLTGFLIPSKSPEESSAPSDVDAGDELDEPLENDGSGDEEGSDRASAKKQYFPSSMGISTLVPAATRALSVTVRWGDYALLASTDVVVDGDGAEGSGEGGSSLMRVWRRAPRERELELELAGSDAGGGEPWVLPVPESGGLEVHVLERPVATAALHGQIPDGTRSVSLFLVNDRTPNTDQPDAAYIFQPELEVRSGQPFVPRPDLLIAGERDWDEQVADLHYADAPELATGHGVAADWELVDGECRVLRTRWIPSADVEQTVPADLAGVELGMDALGELADADAVQTALNGLVDEYRAWITAQRTSADQLADERRDTAEALLHRAQVAAKRIDAGIRVLCDDPEALEAFRVANRAVARALKQRLGDAIGPPAWRPFQLAFLLINLAGIADPLAGDREVVDLLYFPTGGGKTEAYLGLAGFTIVLRRLRHRDLGGLGGAGVAVMMRYTLRLLTIDQLSRAAGLICALELEREVAPERYGTWPFEIGLWVGKGATPNLMGQKGDDRRDTARAKVTQYKSNPAYRPSPIPLEECPWCQTRFGPDSFILYPSAEKPRELHVVCLNFECDFSGGRHLPIVAVDEPLYRRLPAFLIATVDKFATLPWVGVSGALLGGADRSSDAGFFGAAEPGQGAILASPLAPPDLVIQDELHLISGPLGTMAGLYEAAIDGLCERTVNGVTVRPKVVASTATVRRAQDQVQALFARARTEIFPPPGPDRRDSFFAQVVPAAVAPTRRYVGIAAPGRNAKVVMRRVWLALLGAGERIYRDYGGHRNLDNPADGYMTLLGYFNSLRELGGARRIVDEELATAVPVYESRRRVGESPGQFQNRKRFQEPIELTSRVSTAQVADARRRLGLAFYEFDRVDVALATNMISVGLDISRLGLMSVIGQPKSAAEYIQATSRVGRSDRAPGLVVTLLNVNKPRDRSHYERFRHFHETFYRAVEVGSVTPFSARALDRAFAGSVVTLARHSQPALTPARGAEQLALASVRVPLEQWLTRLYELRLGEQDFADEAERAQRLVSVQERIVDLLDSWQAVIAADTSHNVELQYQQHEPHTSTVPQPLLSDMLDAGTDLHHPASWKFRTGRSLRGVEPSVNLILRDIHGPGSGGQ
jgi:hypothetical protein